MGTDPIPIRWTTAFIDRPEVEADTAAAFWTAVTGTTLSARRGRRGQFATLVPEQAGVEAFLRVQTLEVAEPGDGAHLDLHVPDVVTAAERAMALGATAEPQEAHVILHSPAGLRWCLVPHHGDTGASHRPAPVARPGGGTALVDQLAIDVPPGRFEQECAFWHQLTGWELHTGSRPELAVLARPPALPLRLLLHRLDDEPPSGRATCHLDLAASHPAREVAHHEALGGTVTGSFGNWTALADPTGHRYCVTGRDPATGLLP